MNGNIGLANVDDLTRPRSTGRLVNPHVVPYRQSLKPNYNFLRDASPSKVDEVAKDEHAAA